MIALVTDGAVRVAGERGAAGVGTIDVLMAVMQVYGTVFERALRAHGTDATRCWSASQPSRTPARGAATYAAAIPQRLAGADSASTVTAERLRAQLLAGRPARDPLAVTHRLLAVQGQDARGFRLAIRARSSGLKAADVDGALSDERRCWSRG